MATVAAAPPGIAAVARKYAAKLAARAYAAAATGAASALGVVGLTGVTTSAFLTDERLGFAIGGILAVWLASRIPDGK